MRNDNHLPNFDKNKNQELRILCGKAIGEHQFKERIAKTFFFMIL